MRVSLARKRSPVVLPFVAAAALLGAGDARAHPHVWVTTETTVLYENGTIVGLRQKWSFDEFYTAMALQGLDANNDGVYDRSELTELAKVNIDGLKEFDYFTTVTLATEKLKLGAPSDFYLEHAQGPPSRSQVVELSDEEMDKQIAAEEGADKKAGSAPATEPGLFARAWNWLFGAPTSEEKSAAKDKGKDTAPAAPAKVLSLNFTLPLAQPVLAEAEGFSFSIGDPSFFIAFEPAAKNPVVLGPGAPASCRLLTADAAKSAAAPPATTGSAANPSTGDTPPAEPNPAADQSRLAESFVQQFGGPAVSMGLGRAVSISCGPRS